MNKTDGLSAIEKPVGSMKILLHLHQHEKATVTNLLQRENLNQRTTYSALEHLQKEGLICLRKGIGFPLSKYYFLTDKGKIVAKQLDRVAAVLVQ